MLKRASPCNTPSLAEKALGDGAPAVKSATAAAPASLLDAAAGVLLPADVQPAEGRALVQEHLKTLTATELQLIGTLRLDAHSCLYVYVCMQVVLLEKGESLWA